MQTTLADFIRGTPQGTEAESILRACVHCGFCTATCPTYQLLGDELDGPRGRIYLIKQVLEGAPVTQSTRLHLDRCLTCRSCESTCPSGVQYGRLADIGRNIVEQRVPRTVPDRIKRWVLKEGLSRPAVFGPALRIGQMLKPLLPQALQDKLQGKPLRRIRPWPTREHPRRMLVLEGCVQPALAPNVNAAAARVLDAVGVQLVTASRAGCCGAVRFHLNDQEGGRAHMRRNIDAWWPYVDGASPVEAIVMTASGCGVTVRDYGHLLAHDPAYADKAARISALTRDLSEIVAGFEPELVRRLRALPPAVAEPEPEPVAYHPPCSLQHGQQVRGKAEGVLRALGVEVRLCAEAHLCCGSAGTYSLLQPALATQLRDRKLDHVADTGATRIVSANTGCIGHLQSGTATPVEHWIELVDRLVNPEQV
jgi:glycolate oxidase iron-sulfur subunit